MLSRWIHAVAVVATSGVSMFATNLLTSDDMVRPRVYLARVRLCHVLQNRINCLVNSEAAGIKCTPPIFGEWLPRKDMVQGANGFN